MNKTRPVPPRLLPHINALKIERSVGAGADGRKYAAAEYPKRCLIVEGTGLVNGKYDPQSVATGTVYVETSSLSNIPDPESRVIMWYGTERSHSAFIESWSRYYDPQIGDVLEIRLK